MLHLHRSSRPNLPAVVFLHAIGTSGWMWQEQIEQLTDFDCLIPDLPGHGHSHDVRWRSCEQTADLVAEIIRKNVPSGRAHVVGLSLGACVGLTLLARHPSVVERALLSGINVLPLPNRWLIDAAAYAIAPLIKTRLFARLNARALNIPADRFEAYRQSLQPLSIRDFIGASHDASAFSLPANAAAIQTPTLLVAGEHEHPLILASMARLRQVLPNSQARLAKGVGHAWNGERPDLFAATVKAWCAQRELPDELMNLTIR
ncbi:alpha/beta fold hydrolase [Tardiphaga sp. 804_B3_N1_9]|uniref:alpha/beta fold hydrolase n=1 Tax=Tardiphaga TaxID=1395974 RepID=UPI0030B890D4